MEKKNISSKILAVSGSALTWFPVLAPIFFSMSRLGSGKIFNFDWLMPAELFPSAIAGGGLLIAAAMISRLHRKIIFRSFGIMILLLVGGQIIAVVTGLASGETEPNGWQWGIVIGTLAGYCLSLITMGIGGIILIHDLFLPPVSVPGKPINNRHSP